MRIFTVPTLIVAALIMFSCSSDDNSTPLPDEASCTDGFQNGDETAVDCGGSCTPCEIAIENPTTYDFERNGESTVSFDGQSTRILMGTELLDKMMDNSSSAAEILAMYAHETGEDDFQDPDLNASDKNIRSKTAASADFFGINATDQALIRADFETWIQAQVDEVYPNWNLAASAGNAGQIADGGSTRYVSAHGLEYNQLFNKSLIGGLMVDQSLNNYLSPAVLDAGTNRADNDAGTVEEGKPFTTMEHKWDEAYGYVYGLNADPADPNADLGADRFLNNYIGRLESDSDFAGIADDIFQAFKLGRAAIVAGNYEVRDEQAQIIRENISLVIGVRAVHYLQGGKITLNQDTPDYGGAFHDLSEAYGFIYSLQFTRMPDSDSPYFNKSEVDTMLNDLLGDGPNGLWDVTPDTLDSISEYIVARFNFTIEQATN